MSIYKLIAAMIFVVSPFGASVEAQETKINIINRTAQSQPIIIIKSQFNFEQDISLKLNADPKFSVSEILIETISKFVMTDTHGIIISSGFDIDLQNNLVVAFSGGTSEIIRTNPLPDGFQVIGSFKDANGNFVSPPVGSLAVYNTSGEKLCFEYETVTQAPPKIVFTLLLDKSYSMVDEFSLVKQTATDFLGILPSAAQCAVASFDATWTYTRPDFQSCAASGFGIEAIEIGTTTDIYSPLKDAYLKLSQPRFQGYQKAVIIITDGYMESDPVKKQELLSLRGNILTFVYFIGGEQRYHFEGLTNRFLEQRGNVKNSMLQYFGAIGQAYNTQKVLNVRSCQGGAYANP